MQLSLHIARESLPAQFGGTLRADHAQWLRDCHRSMSGRADGDLCDISLTQVRSHGVTGGSRAGSGRMVTCATSASPRYGVTGSQRVTGRVGADGDLCDISLTQVSGRGQWPGHRGSLTCLVSVLVM